MVLYVMLADKVWDRCWIIVRGFVTAAVDGGVDEKLDGVFQRCVDERFALVFFARLVGTSGDGGLFNVLALCLIWFFFFFFFLTCIKNATYLDSKHPPNRLRGDFLRIRKDTLRIIQIPPN